MTIDEAIKAMQDEANNIPVIPHSRLHSAHLVGIEALKRYRVIKQESVLKPFTLLPGETEETKND